MARLLRPSAAVRSRLSRSGSVHAAEITKRPRAGDGRHAAYHPFLRARASYSSTDAEIATFNETATPSMGMPIRLKPG